ncbi:hypothetical protein [Mycoplasma phocoenae]|uniref:Recombination protein RecR n=1 Tax=Mycoplasma phocoenae TaxID=754517 RepID=A0A858U7K7_9MOLU|nr:hypothetical protein [Mycoplasma phocoenae]QJG67203.1 hypothetical protein HGG69_02720 [Mycoplasma phocoenae]
MNSDKKYEELQSKLSAIPGISKRGAEKIINYFVEYGKTYTDSLINSINDFQNTHTKCILCNNHEQTSICSICEKRKNSKKLMLVVEASDIKKFETLEIYNGKYFVLGYLLDGNKKNKYSDDLIQKLKTSINQVKEITIGWPLSIQGQYTLNYIKSLISDKNTQLFQLMTGVPVNATIDYVDPITLKESLENKKEI